MKKKHKPRNVRIIPFFLVCVLLFFSCCFFTLTYVFSDNPAAYEVYGKTSLSRGLFCANFYVFFALYVFFIAVFYFETQKNRHFFVRILAVAVGILAGFSISDFFTVKLCAYLAWIIAVGVTVRFPRNLLFTLAASLFFTVFQYHFNFLGTNEPYFKRIEPRPQEAVSLALVLAVSSLLVCLVRYFFDRLRKKQAMVKHLNLIMTQMSRLNQNLQEDAFASEERAAEEERLRITREIHDSAGYFFVNIIALMDAVVSNGGTQSEDFYQTVRKQASEGLQETRRILRKLRAIQTPQLDSISAVYRLKKVFEEVTGITVEVQSGNMSKEYGQKITAIITRILQEAFTNSVRHGHASHILIHCWEFEATLNITVTDNGIGARQIVKGIGLAGMEERLAAVGGKLNASTPREGGFRVAVTIPLDKTEYVNEYTKTESITR